jgi:L-ascorbate metabolism protein UlaG (beta-lactamase superfamily)
MKITAINHASILIEEDGNFILTDPWYISPAFANWVQKPSPDFELIKKIGSRQLKRHFFKLL